MSLIFLNISIIISASQVTKTQDIQKKPVQLHKNVEP